MPPVGCLEVSGGAPDGGSGGLGSVTAAARPDVARAGGRPSASAASSAAAGKPGQPLREEGGGVAHDVLVHEAAGDGLDGGGHRGRRIGAAAVAEVVGAGADAGGGAGGGGTVEGAAVAVSPAAAAAEGRVPRDGGVGVGGPSRAAVAIFILMIKRESMLDNSNLE